MNALNSDPFAVEPRASFVGRRPNELERLMVVFRRRYRLFLLVFAGGFLIVAFLATAGPPRYSATATLIINDHSQDVLHLNAITQQDAEEEAMVTDSAAVDTQVEVLRSRAMASQIVDQLHLERDPEFNAALRPPGKIARLLGATWTPQDTAHLTPMEHEQIVNAVMADMDVRRVGLTYTVGITFTSFDPGKAEALANAIAQAYLTQGVDAKVDQTTSAATWLNDRLNQLRQDVQTADEAVEQYKIANNLMSGAGSTLTEQEVSTVTSQLAQARADEAAQDARLATATQQMAAGSNGGDAAEALNNPVVESLRKQQGQASAQLADLESRYGDKHPDVVKAKRSLADLNAQIQTEIQRVLSNLKALAQ